MSDGEWKVCSEAAPAVFEGDFASVAIIARAKPGDRKKIEVKAEVQTDYDDLELIDDDLRTYCEAAYPALKKMASSVDPEFQNELRALIEEIELNPGIIRA